MAWKKHATSSWVSSHRIELDQKHNYFEGNYNIKTKMCQNCGNDFFAYEMK